MTRKPPYVRNRRSRVVHKFPTREGCNWDQVPRKFRQALPELHVGANDRLCAHCFREDEDLG